MIEPPFPSEYVITGGLVVDGRGGPAQRLDVRVSDGRMMPLPPGSTIGGFRIDVDGLVVSPGFIDVHSHADLQALTAPEHQVQVSRLRQGVTTEVTGNCGFSPFPVPPTESESTKPFLELLFGPDTTTFSDLGSFVNALDEAGPACNIAPLVGHGTLRVATLGMSDRPPTQSEMSSMRSALELALDAGAFGLSTGLVYPPATFADADEVEQLVREVAGAGAIYATHVRNETDMLREAIQEAIHTGRNTGVSVHISHLKVAGRSNWGSAAEIIGMLDAARSEGVDVTADAYPYTAGSTMLHSTLPPWLVDAGIDGMLARLQDPVVREEVDRSLTGGIDGWQNLGSAAGWDRVTIASSPRHPSREGSSISQLRGSSDRFPADTIARVLLDEGGAVVVVIEAMSEADVSLFLQWPHTVIGSDGIPLPGRPHPRLTGTFPRYLGRYPRETLEASIASATGDPARRFGIPDRGVIRPGAVADLVILDPSTVCDRSTYSDPWQPPEGIEHVFMAGRSAVWRGEVFDSAAGRVLRRRSPGLDTNGG